MLIRDNFPKLGTDLVTALTTLQVNDFSHFGLWKCKSMCRKLECWINAKLNWILIVVEKYRQNSSRPHCRNGRGGRAINCETVAKRSFQNVSLKVTKLVANLVGCLLINFLFVTKHEQLPTLQLLWCSLMNFHLLKDLLVFFKGTTDVAALWSSSTFYAASVDFWRVETIYHNLQRNAATHDLLPDILFLAFDAPRWR